MNRWVCIISLCFVTFSVSACGWFDRKNVKSPAPQPPFSGAESLSVGNDEITVNPVAINNDAGDVTPQDDNLFALPLANQDDRFKRLEISVQNIQDKIASFSPQISRLIDIDSELGQLTFQLEQFLNQKKQAPPVVATPMLAPAMAPAIVAESIITPQQVQALQGRDTNLRNIRLGAHSNKTRLVLETDNKVNYHTDFDAALNNFLVIFPSHELGVNLKRDLNSIVGRSPAVNAITLNEDGQNIIAIFDMANPISNAKDFRAPPDNKYPYHRIVIDLYK